MLPILLDSSLVVAIAASFIALAAFWVAQRSLAQAEMDWRQQKWFELYSRGNDAYDAMEIFQIKYPDSTLWRSDPHCVREFNALMSLMRSTHTMAVIFPRNAEIEKLTAATAIFGGGNEHLAFSKEALMDIASALEGIRQKSLLHIKVLGK